MIIDVSEHNGAINWAKVKAAGVTHAIIRCGYGKDLKKQDDKKFVSYMNGAIAAGIKVGVYFYSYAKDIDSAKSEAAHCVRLIGQFKNNLSLPVFYDCEEENTKGIVKKTIPVFISALNAAGYNCGVYASAYWFKSVINGVNIPFRWVASWGTDDGKPHKQPANCDVWQYTSKGKVSGISGHVDCDKLINTNMRALIDEPNAADDKTGETVNVEVTVLKKGSKCEEVKTIQRLLNALDCHDQDGAHLTIDGDFGVKTEYAVKNYQRKQALTVDGIVGVKTWNDILK